MVTNLMEVG